MPKATAPNAEKIVSAILTEDVLSLDQARNELRHLMGKRPDKTTLYRWCLRGCRGAKLEHVRLGDRFYTSRQALTRFITERTRKSVGG